MIRFRPIPVLTLFSVLALALLISLGRWQWEKFDEKTAAAAEPVPEMTIANYAPIEGAMQFVNGVRPDTREPGWRVFAPVQYGDTTVFIDADFIPFVPNDPPPDASEVRFPASLRFGAPINGASVRPEPPAPLTLPPDPLRRLWFAVDLDAMGRNAGLDNVADYYVAADYIAEDGRATHNPFALAPGADALPPARHLGYSITWYGLAIVLLVIYVAFHMNVGRLSFRAPRPRED